MSYNRLNLNKILENMLKIRLKRAGRKRKPFYRLVLMENLTKRDGRAIADLGYYDPLRKIINFDKQALHKYINYGAYPTDTVRHLIYKMLEAKN